MIKAITILAALLLITTVTGFFIPPKVLQIKDSFSIFNLLNDQCPEALAVECAADVQLTIKECSKAIDEKIDIEADLHCVKDLLADKKHCWPCVCYLAKQKGISLSLIHI